MNLGTLVDFIVQDVPFHDQSDVYIVIQGDDKAVQKKMYRHKQFFKSNFFIKPKITYRYKYKVCQKNEILIEEKGFRNFVYKKQTTQSKSSIDVWSIKEVIIRIQTTQNATLKTLKIVANQKQNQKNILCKSNLELKQCMQNNQIYYEGIVFADCSMNLLELEFNFNAVKYNTNQNEDQYTKKKNYCYCDLKTIQQQSFIDISEEEFDNIKSRQILNTNLSFNVDNNQTNQSSLINPYFELSNNNVEILLKQYQNSIQLFEKNLKEKDLQIKQLQFEKLAEIDIIFFDFQDGFSEGIFSKYQTEYNKIVEEFQQQSEAFLEQYKEQQKEKISLLKENKYQQSSLEEYKVLISNNNKTIECLLEKVIKLKKDKDQNTKEIKDLQDKIQKHKEMLKKKQQIVEELEKQLAHVNEQNQIIRKEKEDFKTKIIVLDKEILEVKKNKDDLEKKNQKVLEENNRITLEKKKIADQLQFKENKLEMQQQDFNQQLQRQRDRQNQTMRKYQDSLVNQSSIIKDCRKKFIDLIQNSLNDLKNIISNHKERDLEHEVLELQNQLTQIRIIINNLLEDKVTLESIHNQQQQIQESLKYFCQSDRIKDKEKSYIQDIVTRINLQYQILQQLDQMKDTIPKLSTHQILPQHQQSVVNIQNLTSPRSLRIQVRRIGTFN